MSYAIGASHVVIMGRDELEAGKGCLEGYEVGDRLLGRFQGLYVVSYNFGTSGIF